MQDTTPSRTGSPFQVDNMLSSWCQYEALKYVSFPTQMLFKCFKLFPIMVMGKLLGNKNYPPTTARGCPLGWDCGL